MLIGVMFTNLAILIWGPHIVFTTSLRKGAQWQRVLDISADEVSDLISYNSAISSCQSLGIPGGFLSHGGTPSHHPFFAVFFPEINHPFLGNPNWWKSPWNVCLYNDYRRYRCIMTVMGIYRAYLPAYGGCQHRQRICHWKNHSQLARSHPCSVKFRMLPQKVTGNSLLEI